MIDTIGTKVAQSLVSSLINKGLKKITASDYTPYEKALQKVIVETVDEYEKNYPIQETDKIRFYDSLVLFDELLKFRFTSGMDATQLLAAIKEDSRIIVPTLEELQAFFDIFNRHLDSSPTLKDLNVEHHYKQEIFRLSQKMDELRDNFGSTVTDLKNELISQNISGKLAEEWSKQLDESFENIKAFKPVTAQQRLTSLETRMTEAGVEIDKKVFSRLYYLQALAIPNLEAANSGTKEAELIIKSYSYNPTNYLYKGHAALAYFVIGETDTAIKLANELITHDPLNSAGWAVRCWSNEQNFDAILNTVPTIVKKRKDFSLHIYHWLKNKNRITKSSDFKQMGLDFPINDNSEPEDINHSNRHYQLVQATYLLTEFYEKDNRFNTIIEMPEAKQAPGFLYAHKILQKLVVALKGTEIEDNHHYYFFQFYCCELILDGNTQHVSEMEKEFHQLKIKYRDARIRMAQACNNMQTIEWTRKGAEILEQTNEPADEIILLFLFLNYMIVDDIAKTEQYFIRYIDYEAKLNRFVFLNITKALREGRLKPSDAVKAKLIELTKKDSEDPRLNSLLKVVLYIMFGLEFENVNDFHQALKELADASSDLPMSLILHIAYGFAQIEQYDDGIQFLKKLPIFDSPSEAYQLYCKILYRSEGNKPELLAHLKKWRVEFQHADFEILSMEAYFAKLQQQWKELADIASFGLVTYSRSQKLLFLLFTAWSEDQDIESIRNNAELVRTVEFNEENRGIAVAMSLIKAGLYEQAREMLYRQASNKSNKISRQSYFTLSIHFPRELLIDYPTVEAGRFVKYEVDGKKYVVEITNENKEQVPQSLLTGKATGDTFTFPTQLGSKLITGKILRVCDKYLALLEEIMLDAENPMSGMNITAMQFEGESPEEMTASLIENFGMQGTLIQESSEETFEKYSNGNVSFTEIAAQIFKKDYFDAYYILTNPKGKLFKSISPANAKNVHIDGETKFVLDASSCCLMYEVSKKFNLHHQKKFVISNLLKAELVRKIAEDKNSPPTEYSLSITQEGVRPHLYPIDATAKRIEHFESLMTWIEQNCEVSEVPERFNHIMKLTEEQKADAFFQMVLENQLLADRPNSLLLTNDVFYYRFLSCPTNIAVSPLIYFHQYFNDREREITDFHLEHNYVGVLITAEILQEEHIKYLSGKENRYLICLENLRFNWNPWLPHIPEVVKFIKHLYLSSFLGKETREQTITAVFSNLMIGLPVGIGASISALLRQEFRLLPIQLTELLELLTNVVEGRAI